MVSLRVGLLSGSTTIPRCDSWGFYLEELYNQLEDRNKRSSYLTAAVRNTSGHYYLNGNWRIDFPREMKFAGASFHYERKPHAFIAPESITALGPTIEPLYICVSLFVLLWYQTVV